MRRLVLIVGCAVLGCGSPGPRPEPTPPPSKTVKLKHQAVEQRLSFDPFDDQSVRQRATTVYYFVADDGSVVEVDAHTFLTTDAGQSFASPYWRPKR